MSKTWLITGASSGLGAALVRELLAAGHHVAAAARSIDAAQSLQGEYGDAVLPLAFDVTDPAQVERGVREAEARFKGIDVLVNNAGLGYLAAVEEGDNRSIRQIFDVNVFGAAAMIRAVLPRMRAAGEGTIINISSINGLIAMPGLGYYTASKFALEGLSEALWQEVEPLGINVLVVEPGGMRTGIVDRNLRANRIEAYAGTAGVLRDVLESDGSIYRSDPRRAARIIRELVERKGDKPHRLLLGSDAFEGANNKLDAMKAEYAPWKEVSQQSDWQPSD